MQSFWVSHSCVVSVSTDVEKDSPATFTWLLRLTYFSLRKWKRQLLPQHRSPLVRILPAVCVVLLCLVAQSCPTLFDPMDYNAPGSSVHGILQARILECVAIPSSRGFSQPQDQTQDSCIADEFFTIWATRKIRILEWVAYPFSRIFSQCRNLIGVSCIADRFFISWATREACKQHNLPKR